MTQHWTRRSLSLGLLAAVSLPAALATEFASRPARVAFVHMFQLGPSAPFPGAFRSRMKELGWFDGRNVMIDTHDAGGSREKLAAIMRELVDSHVDVIVAACTPEAKAALMYTSTIPIVLASVGDPIAAGLVSSLARPGGNVTGVSTMQLTQSAMRISFLREAFPKIAHATVVWNPVRSDGAQDVKVMQAAGKRFNMRVDSRPVQSRDELASELDDMATNGSQALLTVADTLMASQSRLLVETTARRRIPTLFDAREYVDDGGLMSYGPNLALGNRRAAEFVDKILRGANPADLPMKLPTKFELIVNLKTAKALGFVLPRSFLLRADQIIE